MEVISVLGIALLIGILGGIILAIRRQHSSSEDEDIESQLHVPPVGPPPGVVPNSPEPQNSDRWFTLDELKQAEDGRYSWDETGCVFEINSDGSVTTVGRFDPAELRVDPVQEMFERLNNDGLIEMLPRMWSFHAVNNGGGKNDTFVVAWNDDILSVPACPHTIDEVKTVSLIPSSFEGGKSVIAFILSKTANGYLTLLPSNETEYILSLGAKACVERAFGNKVRVRITSPCVMGAYGIAITHASDKSSRISFAFGEGEDYMCCNMIADNGVYEVTELLHNSIIQPAETFIALQHIAKGCMAQFLVREGCVTNYLLLDMFPYTMSLLLKENGRVIKIYDWVSEPTTIPTLWEMSIDSTKTLSFLIGSNELIEDLITEFNIPDGKIEASIELDVNTNVMIKIASTVNDYKINVGELIG